MFVRAHFVDTVYSHACQGRVAANDLPGFLDAFDQVVEILSFISTTP
jgi:hypothetical protein